MSKLKITETKFGKIKLSDGTFIVSRVAIVDVRIAIENTPFGPEFDVKTVGGVSVYPSEDVLKEISNKDVILPGKPVTEGWEPVKVLEFEPPVEEAIYNSNSMGEYRIRVELEPIAVSKNVKYRTVLGEPLYAVKWFPRMQWEKFD